MNKYLILVKHSLPEVLENVPAREWHLSKDGWLRAERLAKQLQPYKPETVISSVEPKAKETAQVLAKVHRLEIQMYEGLHEHDRSNSSHLPKDEFQTAVREFFLNPHRLVFGNETANEAHARFSHAVQSILQTYPNKTITIVSHGTVISLFLSRLIGISDLALWKELGLPSFVVLDMNSNSLIAQKNIL